MTVTQQVPGTRGRDRDGAETDFVSIENEPQLTNLLIILASHCSSPR